MDTTANNHERAVLVEIEQMRWFLGVSRATCTLSDDTTAKVWTAALLLATSLAMVTTGTALHAIVLVSPLAVMRTIGAIFRR